MPETSEGESEGDVAVPGLKQAHVCTLNIRAAEIGASIGWRDGLALIALDDTVKSGDSDSLDPWEKVQLLDDGLAPVV